MTTPIGATDYVLSKSFMCRRDRKHTRELVCYAVDFLAQLPRNAVAGSGKQLTAHLRNRVREKNLSNPFIIILLQIIIPIIVRLILEWWKNR